MVFETVGDMVQRIDDEDLDVDARRRHRHAQCRAEGRAGHAGGRLHPDPALTGARRA